MFPEVDFKNPKNLFFMEFDEKVPFKAQWKSTRLFVSPLTPPSNYKSNSGDTSGNLGSETPSSDRNSTVYELSVKKYLVY